MAKRERPDYEARFEQALRRILLYSSPDQLRRRCEKDYGLSFEEVLEMAYDNIQNEAKQAFWGYRKKRVKKPSILSPRSPAPMKADHD